MSPKEKEQLERMKTLHVRSDIPKDLSIATETFIKQAIIRIVETVFIIP